MYVSFGLEGEEREAVGSILLLLVWKCRLRVPLRFNDVSCFPHSVHKVHPIHSMYDTTASQKVFWPPMSSRGRNAVRFNGIFHTTQGNYCSPPKTSGSSLFSHTVSNNKPHSRVAPFFPVGPKSSTDVEFRTGGSLLRERCLLAWAVRSSLPESFIPSKIK